MHILNENDDDPAMRYEGLACAAFNCNYGNGPNGIAHQGFYNREFVPDITPAGTNALNQIIDSLITKTEGDIKQELTILKNSLTETMKQESGIELIDYIITLIKN